MAKTENAFLGIDLHETEIRAVFVRIKGNKTTIVDEKFLAMPLGAMRGDRIQDAGAIAIALRLLIDGMNTGGCNRAIVGIPGGTILRNLTVPRVPADELPMVVEAEMEHQGMRGLDGGVSAYVKLWADEQTVQSDNVVVLTIDDETTAKLGGVIERAHLTVEALEPVQFAMYRSLMLAIPASATTAAIMVGATNTEIALVHNGHLVAYRNMGTGSQSLLSLGSMLSPFTDDPVAEEAPTGEISISHLDALGTDVYRTLDYFAREHPAFAAIEKVYLSVDTVALATLGGELSRRLDLPVEMVNPGQEQAGGVERLRYAAAYGLAVRGASAATARVPRIDLFSKERSTARQVETQRNFAGSIALSAIAIALGVFGYIMYGRQISDVNDATKIDLARAAQIRSETDLTLQERARRAQQYIALRREGIPLTAIMDYIVGSLEPGVGLVSSVVGADLKVTITGEAIDEPAMIRTAQTLQRSPVLPELMILSFDRPKAFAGITFQLSAKTVPMSRIKPQSDASVQP